MTTTTITTTKLVCTECQRENEPERIYCHNCGERLDRSAVVAQQKAPDPQETHRRLQKMLGPPNMARRRFVAIGKLALAAAVAAALVEIALPPDLPPATKATPTQVDLDLENATLYHKTGALEYSQDQINAYLTYRLTSKKTVLNKPLLTFVRATALFREGACTIAMERSFFGYSLFSRTSYRIETGTGKVTATNVGGWIGRMPVHPAIMKFGDIIFADLWFALDRERKLVGKMGAVSFHDGSVTIMPPAGKENGREPATGLTGQPTNQLNPAS
ncbi:MAG TPA: zinc ribbon domain-containing protein [Chthoniobacterales bacterium]|nr:zinc ribbon domain-containing protein [Chthoniobacterales bacterium]